MAIELDHLIVPSRDRKAAAQLLAALLDVPWSETGVGPFCPVFVNAGLTLDFDQAEGELPKLHYCFRVSDQEFDTILEHIRARGFEYRSTPGGPVDRQVNHYGGGRHLLEPARRSRLGDPDRQLCSPGWQHVTY